MTASPTSQGRDADCTVAICKCGNPVIVVVTAYLRQEDEPDLMAVVREGGSIKHMTAGEFKVLPHFGCTCDAQPTLFDSPTTES